MTFNILHEYIWDNWSRIITIKKILCFLFKKWFGNKTENNHSKKEKNQTNNKKNTKNYKKQKREKTTKKHIQQQQ